MRDMASYRRRSGNGRIRQVDPAIRMAHAADKVPVRSRDRYLALRQDTHMPAQARSAGRRREDAARLDENLSQALLDAF